MIQSTTGQQSLHEELRQLIQSRVMPESAWIEVIIALVVAALLGGYLALAYHLTYTGKKEKRGQMVYTLVLLCLGGSLVWLIVADNLVRAFGLAGALAMIRYRTRMQDPKDTTMVFFAIIIGMACGLHQYFTAVFGSAFIGLVLWIIKIINDRAALSQPMKSHLNNQPRVIKPLEATAADDHGQDEQKPNDNNPAP
ncbi:DUF4956 domain-containing protein [bacterium]|nr:DUF4956 domain-containing protein [bacterium]